MPSRWVGRAVRLLVFISFLKKKHYLMKKFGIVLILVSCLLFLLIPVVPFMPWTLSVKGIISTTLFVLGEITWWGGVVIVGKEFVVRYKNYLDPRNWFKKKEDSEK